MQRVIMDYRGETFTIVRTEWNHIRECPDYLCVRADGSPVWVPAANVRGEDMAAHRAEAQRRKDEQTRQLEAIRGKLVDEWRTPWPGCEHGKAILGRAIDGALHED